MINPIVDTWIIIFALVGFFFTVILVIITVSEIWNSRISYKAMYEKASSERKNLEAQVQHLKKELYAKTPKKDTK